MEDYIKKHNDNMKEICNEISKRFSKKYIKIMDNVCRELVSTAWNHMDGCKAPLRIKNGRFQTYLNKDTPIRKAFLKHRAYMRTILDEILNVCWCHGCGWKKGLGYNYVGSFCNKWCWRANVRDADDDDDWCVLGEMCMECVEPTEYTLARAYHIQDYYNLDPMGSKDRKYTKSAKPRIIMEHAKDYTDDCNYKDLVAQY